MALAQSSAASVRPVRAPVHVPPALSLLVAEITTACGRPLPAMRARVLAVLKTVAADPDAELLTPEQSARRADRYARHVLYGDPAGRFTILSLVWGPSQFSPPHAHYTWCAYAVRHGTLDETTYTFDSAAMRACPLHTAARHAGYCCFDQDGLDHIHRLGNASTEPALSIHVYGVGREHIETRVNRLVDL